MPVENHAVAISPQAMATVGAVDHPLSVVSHGQLRRFLRGQVFPTLMVILLIL
jgi:hypothetical protein